MANRFTDSRKWSDPWFFSLSKDDKLFWFYILDNCDHAGVWKVNLPLVEFFIKDYKINLKTFAGRITVLSEEKWFVESFVLYQQKISSLSSLNPNINCHKSIISILTKEGILTNSSPTVTQPLGKGVGKGIGKGKVNYKGKEQKPHSNPELASLIHETANKIRIGDTPWEN